MKRHFFVCTTERPHYGKPSCGREGGHAVLERLQDELRARPELADEVAVAGSTCLGPCFDGPTLVVYPEATWYARVTEEDVAEIADQHMAGGEPVRRLLRDTELR